MSNTLVFWEKLLNTIPHLCGKKAINSSAWFPLVSSRRKRTEKPEKKSHLILIKGQSEGRDALSMGSMGWDVRCVSHWESVQKQAASAGNEPRGTGASETTLIYDTKRTPQRLHSRVFIKSMRSPAVHHPSPSRATVFQWNLIFYLVDCVLLTSTPTPTLNLPLTIMQK